MKHGFYVQTARAEDDHWWFVHRRRLVGSLLRRLASAAVAGRGLALDVGSGTGGNLKLLEQLGFRPVGLERSGLALDLARAKHPRAVLVQADANRLADHFHEGAFDLVTIFNVLYHRWIDRDDRVLAQAARLLRPGGWLVLTEPALRFLFRRHDRLDFGARRYNRRELERLVRGAGLEIVTSGYFNSIALLPAMAAALTQRLLGTSGRESSGEESAELRVPPQPLNRGLLFACGLEQRWVERFGGVPLGVGLCILARKAQVGM